MAEQYILKVKVDDADIRKLEKRLAGILTGKGITGGSGSGGNGALGKNLAKLGIIATGVVGILALTKKLTGMLVDSSPMLKQMLKLFNFSIMLIFRPIGDFIGFLLRPIMVMFLRKFIIPWYTTAMPVVTKVGTFIGDFVAKLMGEDGIVGIATSPGVIGVALTAGIGITVASAKLAGAVLANFISAGGNMAGNSFSRTSTAGFKADSTWTKFKAQITSLKSAFKFPKPAWVTAFQNAIKSFVNLLMPKPAYTGTGVGGFGQTATVTKNSSTFQKTSAGGTNKSGSTYKQPAWVQRAQAATGSSAGAKGGSSGRNISGSLKMQPGNLLRNAAGLRGGSGGLAFALAPLLDLVPGMPELRDMVGDAMRSTGGIDGSGVDKWVLDNIPQLGNKTTNVSVNIGSIPDKTTADYFLNQLQASTFK